MRTDDEIEALSAFFRGWELELIQLGPRLGRGIVSSKVFGNNRILKLKAGCELIVRGPVPRGYYCIVQSASRVRPLKVLGQDLGRNQLVLLGPRVGMDLYMRHGSDLQVVIINAPAPASEALVPQACCVPRVAAVVTACELIQLRLALPPSLRELSLHCGVAQRTLEYGFKDVYGTTPLAYMRSQRLTRSRLALLRREGTDSVSGTARQYGFTHMGQYCRDYRRLFGETPSTTLARRE